MSLTKANIRVLFKVTVELISNAVVAVLLIVMIGYSFVLNKRLNGLRKNHEEMSRLIASLNQASERAQASILHLKSIGQEAEHALKMEVAKARSLADELALITEAGSDLADRIEQRFDDRKKQVAEPEGDSDWLFQEEDEAPQPSGGDLLNKLRSAR